MLLKLPLVFDDLFHLLSSFMINPFDRDPKSGRLGSMITYISFVSLGVQRFDPAGVTAVVKDSIAACRNTFLLRGVVIGREGVIFVGGGEGDGRLSENTQSETGVVGYLFQELIILEETGI